MMGPLDNVTGGDGVLDTSGGLKLVYTTGIVDTDLGVVPLTQDVTGAAGLQHDPLIGAVGGSSTRSSGRWGNSLTRSPGRRRASPNHRRSPGNRGLQPASSAAPFVSSPSGKR